MNLKKTNFSAFRYDFRVASLPITEENGQKSVNIYCIAMRAIGPMQDVIDSDDDTSYLCKHVIKRYEDS
jgi:hypothetical protein